MMFKSVSVGVVLCILVGCSAPERMQTRQEWLENTSRHFHGKTAQEVLQTGKEVLSLAGANDFHFDPQANRMVASRRWIKHLGFAAGFDCWNFELTAVAEEGGTAATLTIVGSSETIAPMPTDGPSAAADGGSGGGVAMPTVSGYGWPFAPAYDLFWRRMEAILYGSEWVSCRRYAVDPSSQNLQSVTVDPLCFKAKDNPPPGAVVSQTERNHKGGGSIAVQQSPVE